MLVPLESGRFILARVRRAVKCCSPSGFDRVARRASNRLGVHALATQINIERGAGGRRVFARVFTAKNRRFWAGGLAALCG